MTIPSKEECFSSMTFAGYGIEFRPVTPWDLPSLRRWRNSPKISQQMLDRSHITAERQRQWFESIIKRKDQAHWVIWCKGVRTGYVNIRGEGPLGTQKFVAGGFYVADSPVRHALLGYATALLYHEIIFKFVGATELRDTVLRSNTTARQLDQQMGYQEHACEGEEIPVSLNERDFTAAKEKRFRRYFKDTAECRRI